MNFIQQKWLEFNFGFFKIIEMMIKVTSSHLDGLDSFSFVTKFWSPYGPMPKFNQSILSLKLCGIWILIAIGAKIII